MEHCPTEGILGDHFTNPFQGAMFRKYRAEIMNISDDLDIVEMGMDRTGFKKGIKFKLDNETNPGCPQECVGGCGKAGRENGAMECPDIGTRKYTYDAIMLEKGERSQAVRSYADVTREDVKTPLGKNILIIS